MLSDVNSILCFSIEVMVGRGDALSCIIFRGASLFM